MKFSCEPGNALALPDGKRTLLPHIVNNVGGWGKGFVGGISRVTPLPEARYRKWAASGAMQLGMVQPVKVNDRLTVLNMCAQEGYDGYKGVPNPHPLDEAALKVCLGKAAGLAVAFDVVQMPRIGCGLAGGRWENIEKLIRDAFCGFDGEVKVCLR